MAERTWRMDGQSGARRVHLAHAWWSGKATGMADDDIVCHRPRKIIDWGLKHSFTTDGMECLVKIISTPWGTFRYRLYVNGEAQEPAGQGAEGEI